MHSPSSQRESRHVLVTGLQDNVSEDRITNYFSNYGGVQSVDRNVDGIVISFTDIRSARKANNGDHRLDNMSFRMSFHDPAAPSSKNSTSCMTNRSSTSPRAPTTVPLRKRSISPWKEFDEKSLEEKMKYRMQRPLNVSIPKRNSYSRKDGRGSVSPVLRSPRPGLQGFYIENLPRGQNSVLNSIHACFNSHGTIADTHIEELNGADDRRALLIFNNLTKPVDKYAMIMGQKCRVRAADAVDVQVAYNKTVAAKGAMAASLNRDAVSSKAPDMYTVYYEKASRTLYVGNLDSNPTEASLRRRYGQFGTILEIDVKNPESPSPFAFLHYADLDSTVRAVNAFQHRDLNVGGFTKKPKVNFGRSQAANKLWIGNIPPAATEDFVNQRMKMMFEGVTEIVFDPVVHQAVLRFDTLAHSNEAYSNVRTKNVVLTSDGQDYRLSVDFGTEGLLNFFKDRIEIRAATTTAQPTTTAYLSPPPIPPVDMPGRYDDRRRSPPRGYRRSRSREHGRRRSRSTSRTRDRKREKRRGRSSSNDSSSSDSASDSRTSTSSSSNEDRRHRRGNHDRKRRKSRNRDRRSDSRSQERDDVRKKVEKCAIEQPQERAASGDSGFEEVRTLEPPPAPPAIGKASPPPPAPPSGPAPQLHKLPPPQAPPRLPQYTQPPPPLPIPQLPPPIKERPREHQPHPAQPGPSREPTQERPREVRDGHRPREERQRMPGERIHHHDMLTKRPSYDEKRRSDADVSAERKLEDGRIIKPGRPCNRLRDYTSEHDPIIPTMPVNPSHHYPDPRRAAPYHPFQYKLSIVPFQLCEHEQRMRDLEDRRREIRAFNQQMGQVVDPEIRKRSSGSVHSVDARRASGGSLSRIESQEEPMTPHYQVPPHDENARMKQRSDSVSTPTWVSTSGAVKLTFHEPTPPFPQPGLIQSRSGSISIEDRLSKLRRLNQDSSKTPIKLGLDPHSFGTALGGSNHNAPGPRPNLHINIPPTGANYPTTPNSAKSDFSPKVDPTRRMPSTAIPTSSTRQPFTPTAIPPPSHMESQASPLLSAPPPPPLLPRLDATPSLKSPPMTPGSVSRFQSGQTPSPSFTSRTVDFKHQPPPTTPRSALSKPPPPMERKESSRFGSPSQFPPKDKLQPQRQDSMSAMRSPPAGMPVRSMSVSDSKKPQKDTSDYLQHLFNKDKPNTAFAAMKLGKIGKKPDQNSAPSETVKEKEHKKHKEHKLRKKEDGTYETKEERARRKELKRLAKAALERRDKKLEKKKSKEKEDKEKSKKHKKERKERESKKDRSIEKDKKKKKKRKQSGSEESDSESDLEVFNKSVIKDQSYSSDAALAALIGQSMYDRVKRRSSAPKDGEKKRALQALKDKKQKKKRLLLSSSEDDDDTSQKKDSEQSSEDSEAKKSDSESEKEDKHQKKGEKEVKKVSSESDSEEEVPKAPIKKSKKDKTKKRDSLFGNSDIFGANSSDDEEIRPSPSRKSKTSTSDESDHLKKHQKIDYVSLFGSDSVDEKREKRDKQSPSQSKHRKRQPSSNHDETQAKKSKRGSLSSDVSAVSGVLDHRKSRENSLRREEGMDESHMPIEPREEEQRPRLVTKAAMKVFEPLPATSQMQHLSDEDSDDSETAAMPPSQPLSSSSESEVDSMSHVTSHEEHETVVEESSQDSLVLEPPPAPPATFEAAAALSAPPAAVQYEPPMFQAEPQVVVPEEPIRDLEGELAAQAIADDQDMAPGQSSIFDDCEEPIPEYPSHDFIRTEETVLIDPVPVEISEEQVLSESFAEEPLPEEEDEEQPIQQPIHTPGRVSNEFPSPTSLAAHAVAVKSPLTVAVDSQIQTPQRTPVASTIFSPTAHSHSSNEPLTSPVRSTTTPMSSIHQSPLVSPTTNQPPDAFSQNFLSQNRPQMDFFRQQQTNQQVPLQAAPQQSPVYHLNGTSSGLDQRGLAAVPSPSHALSGTSSISSPGTPPSFGKDVMIPPGQHDQANLLNLAGALAMQSLMSLNQQNNNSLLAGAAKLMLNNLLQPAVPAMDLSSILGQDSLASLQNALLLQQYANLTANLNLMTNMKKTEPVARKRVIVEEEGPEAKQLKLEFDNCLDKILREEFEDETDIPSESVSTTISSEEDQEVPDRHFTLKEVLDFNWSSNSTELSAFRKISSSKLPSPSVPLDLDWANSISPPGSTPVEPEPISPLSPTLVDHIRHVALSMRDSSLEDQLEKMPPVWKGRIAIKNTAEITVQMHYMFGQKEYGLNALSTLSRGLGANRDPTMRIGQRMKAEGESLYRLLNRLQSAGTTCLCVPVGNNPEEVQQHARILKNEFAHYFVRKGCAGVASLDYSPKSFIYVFPPNEFTDKFLAHSSPDLFSRIQHKLNEDFSYLFVAIAPQAISDQ